jgi:arabinogalactan oligomer/maltooligosaccharide transport system permease protein
MTEKTKRRKNPTLALILSVIFPGLGQLYNNQVPKGIALLAINLVVNFLLIKPLEKLTISRYSPDTSTLFIVAAYTVIGLVLWVYAIIDAKRTAEKINRELSTGMQEQQG